jgi:hypothetical protein
MWQEGLQRVLQRFHTASIPTLVVNSIPYFGAWDARTCAAVVVADGPRRCGISRTRASVQSDQRLALAAEQAAASTTDADTIDFTSLLCTPRRCATNDGDFFVYMDGHHLSADGALRLVGEFGERISRDAYANR